SLAVYRKGQFAESVVSSNKALAISPGYAEAYNNICAANSAMESWDEAIAACLKALELKPVLELAQNNLVEARRMKKVAQDRTADEYLDESASLYAAGKYPEAVAASRRARAIR